MTEQEKLQEKQEQPPAKPPEQMAPKSDLRRFEEEISQPVMYTDYDHKAFIVTTSIKNQLQKSEDLLIKELQTGFIDPELAFIYSTKLSCAEEWLGLGFGKLAKRRAVHVLIKMNINKSIGGFERRLQAGMPIGEDIITESEKLSKKPIEEQQQDLLGGMKKLFKQ